MNDFERFLFANSQELYDSKVRVEDSNVFGRIKEITREGLKIEAGIEIIEFKFDNSVSPKKLTFPEKPNLLIKYEESKRKKELVKKEPEKVIDRPVDDKEVEQLKNFLERRNIKYLVHFTDLCNIKSIKKHGLLSRIELSNNREIKWEGNDYCRYDKKMGYISLSITNINEEVLQRFISNGSIKHPVIIYLDASLLYKEFETDRCYCDRNAANVSCEKDSGVESLKKMFKPYSYYKTTSGREHYFNREKDGRKDCETTDPQAEILFHKRIDPKYILHIKEF